MKPMHLSLRWSIFAMFLLLSLILSACGEGPQGQITGFNGIVNKGNSLPYPSVKTTDHDEVILDNVGPTNDCQVGDDLNVVAFDGDIATNYTCQGPRNGKVIAVKGDKVTIARDTAIAPTNVEVIQTPNQATSCSQGKTFIAGSVKNGIVQGDYTCK